MKLRDLIDDVKHWWDMIPGWHERIIWFGAGAVVGAVIVGLV